MVDRYAELVSLIELLKNSKQLETYCDNVSKYFALSVYAVRQEIYKHVQNMVKHFDEAAKNTAQPLELRKKAEVIALELVDVILPLYGRMPELFSHATFELSNSTKTRSVSSIGPWRGASHIHYSYLKLSWGGLKDRREPMLKRS